MPAHGLLWKMVWKEYRQQRGLWLVLAACALALQVVIVCAEMLDNRSAAPEVLFAIGLMFSCWFALGSGATLFAGEHDAGTYDTLRAFPVPARHVLTGKVLCALAGVLTMPLLLGLFTILLSRFHLPDRATYLATWLMGLVTALELLTWGMFFSLQMRRPLWAVVFTAMALCGCIAFVQISLSIFVGGGSMLANQWALPARCVIAVLISVIDVWLALGWLNEKQRRVRVPSWPWWVSKKRRVISAVVIPPRRRALGRLIWHEWRQSRGLALGAFGITAIMIGLLVVSGLNSHGTDLWTLPFWSLPGMAAILGGCAFLGDQSQNGFRFFAEQGAKPRTVWLSRQLVWGGLLAIWTVVGLAATVWLASIPAHTLGVNWRPPFYSSNLNAHEVATYILYTFSALIGLSWVTYSAAQVGSLFIRSGVVGFFVGIFLALIAGLWCVLMFKAHVPLLWSAGPLPILLLWSTWLRAPDWITEQTSWRAKLQAAISLASPALLVLGVIAYRLLEVPSVTLPPLDEVLRPPTPEERATAKLYEEAMQLNHALRDSRAPVIETGSMPLASTALENSTPNGSVTSRTVVDIEAIVANFVLASRRPTCRFVGPHLRIFPPSDGFQQLADTILSRAAELDAHGDHDGSLELQLAVTRFAKHLYQSGTSYHSYAARGIEGSALEQLVRWSAQPGRTPDEIHRVIQRLDTECFSYSPPWDTFVLNDYYRYSQMLATDTSIAVDRDREFASFQTLTLYMPWEKIRVRRVLAYYTSLTLSDLQFAEQALQNGGAVSPHPNANLDQLLESTMLVQSLPIRWHLLSAAWHETGRRAARIRLGLLQWRAQHGELPAQLDQLKQLADFGDVPTDPFAGWPFRYIREGFEETLSRGAANGEAIPPDTPFIWSCGPFLTFSLARTNNSEMDLLRSYFRREFGKWPRGFVYASSLKELWETGWCFTIPLSTAPPKSAESAPSADQD